MVVQVNGNGMLEYLIVVTQVLSQVVDTYMYQAEQLDLTGILQVVPFTMLLNLITVKLT